MDPSRSATSRLFVTTCIEGREELDEKFERCYSSYQQVVGGLSEKEAHDALSGIVSKDSRNHEEICLGLLFSILVDPANAPKHYRDLTYVSRDGLHTVLTNLGSLIEKFPRMLDSSKTQLIWLLREMVRNSVTGLDAFFWNLMRQIAGGDTSAKNIWLAEAILDIYIESSTWLAKHPVIISLAVYTYLRLMEDHNSPSLVQLRQKEAQFVVGLLREHFNECLTIGRDLIRLLQHVARVPEIETFWKDLFYNHRSLSATFTGILQVLETRTSRRYLQSRLTPDMEKKIVFIMSQVRFGMHKRYQDWFQRQYLSTPESQSLRCDIIRFIVGVFHPTNELLSSDIIPRWAVIGWLLTTCTSPVAAANAKLALFYDWLFYVAERDNIMNIEPAILVMHHSLRPHPAITATLLDFLCRIIPNFYPPLAERVRLGIYNSLKQIMEKRVLATLSSLFDNPKMDKDLRNLVQSSFAEFCGTSVEGTNSSGPHFPTSRPTKAPLPLVGRSGEEGGSQMQLPSGHENDMDSADASDQITATNHLSGSTNHVDHSKEPTFSDDDDDVPLAKVRLKEKNNSSSVSAIQSSVTRSERTRNPTTSPPPLEQLDAELKTSIENLQKETDNEVRCEVMEKLTQVIMQESYDGDVLVTLAQCLHPLLKDHFSEKLLPPREEISEETLEDSVGRPLFVLMRVLAQTNEDDPSRHPVMLLLAELRRLEPRLGFHFLFFLKASKLAEGQAALYTDFCQIQDRKALCDGLVSDLKVCQEENVPLFCWLIPDIYSSFPGATIGNVDLLQLVVSVIDATQLQDLVCLILQGNLLLFRKDSFISVLDASLSWETWEQHCLWQLIAAHNIPVDYVLPILPKLEFANHAEALTSIVLRLKQERPTHDLVKPLLSRPSSKLDQFAVSVLRFWSQEHEEELAKVVASTLEAASGSASSPGKRKRAGTKANATNSHSNSLLIIENILTHLDHLRLACKQAGFFQKNSMQSILLQVQNNSTEATKRKFSDLFALAEVEEMEVPTTRGNKGRRKAPAKSNARNSSRTKGPSDSDDDSSEEEVVKVRNPKKRKKPNPVNSDSD